MYLGVDRYSLLHRQNVSSTRYNKLIDVHYIMFIYFLYDKPLVRHYVTLTGTNIKFAQQL